MKAVEMINRSLNLANILSRQLDQEDDEEGADGLFWLNSVLREKSSDGVLLPYYAHIPITAIPGQEVYFIANLVTAEILTYTLRGVRYSTRGENRNKYFGTTRAENISSLPYKWYWERVNGGMNIYLYFFPADTYLLTITGLPGLQKVDFNTEFDDFYDDFVQKLLMFELSDALCIFYKLSLPPRTAEKLKELRNKCMNINPRDLSIKKQSLLGNANNLSYMQINLKDGWTA